MVTEHQLFQRENLCQCEHHGAIFIYSYSCTTPEGLVNLTLSPQVTSFQVLPIFIMQQGMFFEIQSPFAVLMTPKLSLTKFQEQISESKCLTYNITKKKKKSAFLHILSAKIQDNNVKWKIWQAGPCQVKKSWKVSNVCKHQFAQLSQLPSCFTGLLRTYSHQKHYFNKQTTKKCSLLT